MFFNLQLGVYLWRTKVNRKIWQNIERSINGSKRYLQGQDSNELLSDCLIQSGTLIGEL